MKHNDPAKIGNAMSFGSTPLSEKNVKTNIARSFIHLVDTHFPAGHKLHKPRCTNLGENRFSSLHKLHHLLPDLYAVTCFRTVHLILNRRCFLFTSHMYFDSSVSFFILNIIKGLLVIPVPIFKVIRRHTNIFFETTMHHQLN